MTKFSPAVLIVGMLFSTLSFATTLECMSNGYAGLVVDKFDSNCKGADGSLYTLKFRGAGIVIKASMGDFFKVHCPYQNNPEGTYYGVRASIGAGVGGTAMGFASVDGVCFAEGITGELGYSASLNQVKIKKLDCRKDKNISDCELASRI